MRINHEDTALLSHFFVRECADFLWKEELTDKKNGREEGLKRGLLAYIEAFNKTIKDKEPADFLVIESLTNLGQVQRSLKLTPLDWDSQGGILILTLPPSPPPRGFFSVRREGELSKSSKSK